MFRTTFSEDIFKAKYAHPGCETWPDLAKTLVTEVCRGLMEDDEVDQLIQFVIEMKFLPGGRYLYYAGREKHFYNNCYLLKAETDTREDWANLSWKAESCLMTGGGIGIDYSIYRPSGIPLKGTGGLASGPIPKMQMINEIGRHVMQGGSRRSAIYASLNHSHADIEQFLRSKNWADKRVPGCELTLADLKQIDFNFPAPLDMTNISVNYDTAWLSHYQETGDVGPVFKANVEQALKTGEPGFSFNFFEKENETLRNAPVSGNTHILTDEGYKKINDIAEKEVKVWTGKQFATTTFKKTMENAPIVEVGMTGDRSIKAEPSHEFLVERWEGKGKGRHLREVVRVPASELQVGDILHVSPPTLEVVSPDPTYYTLGFTYGDGHISNGKADLTLCTEEKKQCLTFMDRSMISSLNESDGRGYTRMTLKHNLFVSKIIYPDLPTGLVPSFVAGLFDADGNWEPTQRCVRLSSVSKEFLTHVRRDLERIGIMSVINKGGPSGYGGQNSWMLVIMRGYVARFSGTIPTRRVRPEAYKPYRRSNIKVTSLGVGQPEDVFCCDVKVEEHSFMAEGVIISNCTEVCSEDDSDVCNLGSMNMGRIENIEEFNDITNLSTKFLLCGTLKADLPYEKVHRVREKNRRLGLGLMGVHEWLLKRGYKYGINDNLKTWLEVYRNQSDKTSREFADKLSISRPVANRALAPTGTIGILAGTSTGIEPVFAVAYKRRYLKRKQWHYQYVVDATAKELIDLYGMNPDEIETALDLAKDYERRIAFQAEVQDYVDMSISSTINLPPFPNVDPEEFTQVLAKYAHRLRGFTCYPDGSRGGQPLTVVPYAEAITKGGKEHIETHDICDISGKGGVCGS